MKKISIYGLGLFIFVFTVLPWLIPLHTEPLENHIPFPESKFIYFHNTKIHYRHWEPEAEKDKGEKILFIHGFSGSSFCFRYMIPAFVQKGYTVVAMDVPAYGYSDRNMSREQLPDYILAGLLLLNVNNESDNYSAWTLMGHSMGASLVYDMASHFPTICKRLILVDGVPVLSPENTGIQKLITSTIFRRWAEVSGKYLFFTPGCIEKLLTSAYGPAVAPDTIAIQGYLQPLLLPGTANAILNKFRYAPAIDSVRISDTLNTVVIWGEKDAWIPVHLGEKFMNTHPQAKMHIIPEAGHCPVETHPEEVLQFILNN